MYDFFKHTISIDKNDVWVFQMRVIYIVLDIFLREATRRRMFSAQR